MKSESSFRENASGKIKDVVGTDIHRYKVRQVDRTLLWWPISGCHRWLAWNGFKIFNLNSGSKYCTIEKSYRLIYNNNPIELVRQSLLTINEPVYYMARAVMILMRGKDITWAIGRVGP